MAMAICFHPYIPYPKQIPLLVICYGPNAFLGYIFIFCLGLVVTLFKLADYASFVAKERDK